MLCKLAAQGCSQKGCQFGSRGSKLRASITVAKNEGKTLEDLKCWREELSGNVRCVANGCVVGEIRDRWRFKKMAPGLVFFRGDGSLSLDRWGALTFTLGVHGW